MDKRIGAQYFTLRDYIKTVEDFEETCRKVKEIGYQLIQISGTPLKAAEMKPIIDKLEEVSGKKYENNTDEMRVIADHIRGAY